MFAIGSHLALVIVRTEQLSSAPSGRIFLIGISPRALPWAGFLPAFGAQETDSASNYRVETVITGWKPVPPH